jgi:hypothetical protein
MSSTFLLKNIYKNSPDTNRGEWLASRLCRFTPGKEPLVPIGGWVNPRAGPDVLKKHKNVHLVGNLTRVVKAISRHYTD